ncbi:hypothetical protein RYX45_05120 [Alkalihalophilus pseudofirmus]|uniref:Uncharacterized protein n=1 Tax=Alkalihalophilus pseudofirmus TaxID=79885 RepID=A0AAJ2L0X8_ALKPS|nr:hypothetical protein [Alkalihalophilus pseudofirmus]MDV2884550.1 hypothetical protein [Alkalihalophilus pseudofirmus]
MIGIFYKNPNELEKNRNVLCLGVKWSKIHLLKEATTVDLIILAAILVTIIFTSIAIFQVLLSLGYPLGEAAMGGYHKILPAPLRIVSAFNALILLFMAYVFLKHAGLLTHFNFSLPTNVLVWVFTAFLGVNTLANFVSKSKKERVIMTPLSGVAFILCLIISM